MKGGWCWKQDPCAIALNGHLYLDSVKGRVKGETLIDVYDLKQRKAMGTVVAHGTFDRDDNNSCFLINN